MRVFELEARMRVLELKNSEISKGEKCRVNTEKERYQVYVDTSVCTIKVAIQHLMTLLPTLNANTNLVGKAYELSVVDADPLTKYQALRLEWPDIGALRRVRKALK